MKASRFLEAEKAFILKQANDGMPVAEIGRKAGISQATYFNWKKKYDGSTKSRPLLGGLVVGLKVGFRHQPLIRTVHVIARNHVTFLG